MTEFLREDVASGKYWKDFDAFAAQKKENNKSFFAKFGCGLCAASAESVKAEEVDDITPAPTLLEDPNGKLSQKPSVASSR